MTDQWDFTWDYSNETNAFFVEHPIFIGALERIRACYESFGKTSMPRCVAILGPSRVGKTTVIDKFINSLGKDIKFVVVVRLKTVKNTKSLASQILKALGDPACDFGTESQMTLRIIYLMGRLGIKLLIIDDIQNIIDRKSQKLDYLSAELLKSLISDNEVKVPMALLGLPNSKILFDVNEQLKGRFRSIYLMKRFDWRIAETKTMLKDFLSAVQDKIEFEQGVELHKEETAFRFFCASNGIVGLMMNILVEAKSRADSTGTGVVTMQHLADAYDEAICKDIDEEKINPFVENEPEMIAKALRSIIPKNDRAHTIV